MATRRRSGSGAATRSGGEFKDYTTEVSEGMVVLDAVHQIQAEQANDLAVRWNCKAGKCGSCSAEINGKPRLMCMTRLNRARPRRAGHRRADAGVPADHGPGHRRVLELPRQEDASRSSSRARRTRRTAPGACSRPTSTACRSSASASSASSARTSATCCATTTCSTSSSARGFLVYAAALEMHPLDTEDRVARPEGRSTASATATSPSAAPRSVRRTSRSPTTPSSR